MLTRKELLENIEHFERTKGGTKLLDRTHERCESCGLGFYEEDYIWDDWDGVLHCSNCGVEVDRYDR